MNEINYFKNSIFNLAKELNEIIMSTLITKF